MVTNKNLIKEKSQNFITEFIFLLKKTNANSSIYIKTFGELLVADIY